MSSINKYMSIRLLNPELRIKVTKYFEYLFKEEQNSYQDENQLLNTLASTLKKEVLTDMYGKVLLANKIFSLNFSAPFIRELSILMKEKVLGPEEILFEEFEDPN